MEPPAIELGSLVHIVHNKRGEIEITCSELHLTYLCHFPEGLQYAIKSLEASLGTKGYSIPDVSAVEGSGACSIIGSAQAHTHIAIRIKNHSSERYRLRSLKVLAIGGFTPHLFHVRLIKTNHQWEHIINVGHHVEASPLQRLGGGALVVVQRSLPKREDKGIVSGTIVAIPNISSISSESLPPGAKGDVARYLRAKKAFDNFTKGNNGLIQEILARCPVWDRGRGHWYSYFDDASGIADYFVMHDLAVAFHNCLSPGHIVAELQKVCNSGTRPGTLVLCYSSAAIPPDDLVVAIQRLCDEISSGTVLMPKFRPGDVPLSVWKPNVLVFANFTPMVDTGFDNGHWALSLPRPMNNTGQLIVPPVYVDALVEAAKRHLKPSPEVAGVRDFLDSLGELFRDFEVPKDVLPSMFTTIRAAARALFSFFTPGIGIEILRRGYRPVFTIHKNLFQSGDSRPIPELQVVGDVVRITERTHPLSIIGKIGKIGNVYVRFIPLTEEEKAMAEEKFRNMMAVPTLDMIDDIARDMGLPAVKEGDEHDSQPQAIEDAPETRGMGLFWGKRDPFPNFGSFDVTAKYPQVATFLAAYRMTRGYTVLTPLGEFGSSGWILDSVDRPFIVEVDAGIPLKGEAFKMLSLWNERGIRMIRLRADEIVGEDWENGFGFSLALERAIMDTRSGPFYYLERDQKRQSWRELRESLAPFTGSLIGHEEWWEKHIGPYNETIPEDAPSLPVAAGHDPDERESPPSGQAETDRSESPPPSQAEIHRSESASAAVSAPSETCARRGGWAVYLRTSGTRGLTGDALAVDISSELARQRSVCYEYAGKRGLVPVVGECCFTDQCSAETPPGARPGLQALLSSGASGILCVDRDRMAPVHVSIGPWLEAMDLDFKTVVV
jgi:hypothetical protein